MACPEGPLCTFFLYGGEAVKKKSAVAKILTVVILGGIMFGLFGCGKEKYSVNFENVFVKECFTGLKDSYAEGAKVKLCYGKENIGTDTDYAFFLDNERLNVKYSESRGYIVTFKMPDHDVTLKVGHSNSMYPGE